MKLTGQIIDKSVILGDNGKKYSYEAIDFHDENIKIGDYVSFIAEKDSAVFIKYIKDGVAPVIPEDEKPFLQQNVSFEFVEAERKEDKNLYSKLYSNFIRKYGLISCILPLVVASILLFFKAPIGSFLLSIGGIRGIVNPNFIDMYLDVAIIAIWLIAYLMPLNIAFNGLCVATGNLYAKRQINSFNLFFILALLLTLAKINNFFHVQNYGIYVSIVIAILGLCAYFYKAKAFFYLGKKSGVKLFIIALLLDFIVVVGMNIVDEFMGMFDFGKLQWQHIGAYAIIAPLYIISFLLVRRIN